MRLQYLLAGVLLAAGALPALAQDTGSPPSVSPTGTGSDPAPQRDVSLPALDTDRDGSISAKEAQAVPELAKEFGELDRNGDGALEPAEFARFEQEQLQAPEPGTGSIRRP